MNPAEIVVSEVQAVRRPKVVPLLAETVRESRKAAHLSTDSKVLAFHNRRADAARIRATHNWDHLRIDDFGGTVAPFAFARCAVHFDELGEIAAVMQCGGDRGTIRLETVRGHLEVLMSGRMAQAFNENIRGGLIATAQREVENELGIAFDGDKTVGVTDAAIVRFLGTLVAFLLLDESPNLIALDILHRDIHDQTAHNGSALFASQHQQIHDGVAIQIGDAFGAADGVAFDQQAKREYDPLLRNVASSQGGFVGFGVGLFAERAAKTAKAIAVFAKALAINLATSASHFGTVFYVALHTLIIQLSLAVCQRKTAIVRRLFLLYFVMVRRIESICRREASFQPHAVQIRALLLCLWEFDG